MPQPRRHQHTAARVAAHRARQAREGRQRLDVTVTAATAAKLKAEAAARGCTIGEALEALLDASNAPPATEARASTTTRGQAGPAPTGAAETAAPDQTEPQAPNGPEKATSAASTSQAATTTKPTRRRRCPRSGDPGVETRRTGTGWDTFAVIVDGHQVGTVTEARAGWRGETTDGRQVEGRVATAAVNRVLKAAHQSGLLEANTAAPEQAGAA